ncbi:MAG: methylmalonyl-CoA mutase family protein, partial [Bacillota bacterium]
PTEDAVKIALRTQQLIAEESGVADTIDPLGGSYYIEELTDKLIEEAREYLAEIDELGGMAEAVKAGYVQREIQESAYKVQKEIEDQERVVIGVNKHKEEEEKIGKLLKVDPALETAQCEELNQIKTDRDRDKTQAHLDDVRAAAQNGDNLMYPILDAVRDYVSLGEICDVLRDEFGEYEAKLF